MACMDDWKSYDFKCTYLPCGYEEKRSFHKYALLDKPHENEWSTFFCPKCGLFTFKQKPLDLGLLFSRGGLTGILYLGTPHPKLKHIIVWKPVPEVDRLWKKAHKPAFTNPGA